MSKGLREVSVLGLAHVGDAVFELMVRTWLCTSGTTTAKNLHSGAVSYVSAKAQSEAFQRIKPLLTEHEFDVYKRGRNAYINSVPRSSSHKEYHAATGLEALFGHLYLSGNVERLSELFEYVIDRPQGDESQQPEQD
ncbi:MAG: ribonuclease III [Oscillospiraceae bacterium]|nr:ribonuclease III [Oscillospiraceae bacterium]